RSAVKSQVASTASSLSGTSWRRRGPTASNASAISVVGPYSGAARLAAASVIEADGRGLAHDGLDFEVLLAPEAEEPCDQERRERVDAPVVVADVAVVEATCGLNTILGGDEFILQLQEVEAGA